MSRGAPIAYPMRLITLLALLGAIVIALVWRAVDLQVMNRDFLQDQGDARHLRALALPAHRGMITDRGGEPLAISTPVDSVWVNPKELVLEREGWRPLARLLGMDVAELRDRIMQRADREFVYLKRRIDPELAQRVMALEIPGVSLQREYRRYYPLGEVAAHLVGMTNVDDAGQEGMELAYDNWLRGTSGSKWVLKDRLGHVVENVAGIKEPDPGKDLVLSIDNRIQYLAYRELKAAVQLHHAHSGSAVVLDVATGEVLAMVNQPSYNPNNREGMRGELLRNRAVTDLFEPGSTMKPFTVAAALESGKYRPGTFIDTAPGYYKIGRHLVRDKHNLGYIDVTTIIEKSSNVGISKIALAIEPAQMWKMFSGVGFGQPTGGNFPGEVTGLLADYRGWKEIERATLSFGYGLSVTPLQLCLAYTVLGDKGRLKPVSFVPIAGAVETREIMSERTATEIIRMMETVVSEQGTANLARVAGYRVAGKTGTVQKLGAEGYSDKHYVAVFAGLAPASNPRLAMAVVINDPQGDEYYGGQVAAPVFSRVMTGALRMLGMLPDELPRQWRADAGRAGQAGGRDAGAPASTVAESYARPVLAGDQGVM
ncbi:MAG: penicillin-binding protein 2 [Gammaproteobacteria bacterium]|nr:penicillin-binding protein 2 [Gammaproteobacteria bacterium]